MPFRRLLLSFWTANLGDGIMLAAAPLLVASLTDNAALVALGFVAPRLPWLLIGLHAGAIADRVDRRALMIVVNLVRVVALGVLGLALVTGVAGVGWVVATLLVLGVAECFNDTTASTAIPMLVERRDLGIANARRMFGVMTINQLLGPPLGALLFTLGAVWPVVGQMICLGAVVVLLLRLRLPPMRSEGGAAAPPRRSMTRDVVEGARWLAAHSAVRTLALTVLFFNVTFGASWSVLVVYADERLGLGASGYGLLISASAAGGIVGALAYGALERRFALGAMMRAGLVVETCLHAVLAATTWPAVAMLMLVAFGVQASVWGTTSSAVRQRAVPDRMQGRVTAVYMIGGQAGLVVGAGLGGVLAQLVDVRATLLASSIGSALILALIWRALPRIAHAPEPAEA